MVQVQKLSTSSVVAALAFCAFFLAACSGDGGGGGGPGVLLLITADGASAPLFENIGGVPMVPATCPTGVFVNARITFTFNGPVDPFTLPLPGPAFGPITILDPATGDYAQGTFTVEDDPALPSGNMRRVVFRPTLPEDPNGRCNTGLAGAQVYEISVPSGTATPLVLNVRGSRLDQGGETCFKACGCPFGGGCVAAFLDLVLGPPMVLDTLPATGDPAPGPIDPCAIVDDTIQIHISEPLDPSTVNLTNVRVINVASGAQLPGSLVFHQATNATAGDLTSQIDYVAAGPLVGSRTYEVILGPGLTDLAGNPIQQPGQLFFQTLSLQSAPQPPIVENFDAPGPTSGTAGGAISWSGDGFLRGVFPVDLTGTGADGNFNPPAGMVTLIDTNELVGGQSRMGKWNFQNVNIPLTATVRVIGPYLAHIRCTGSFTLNGTLQAIPGQISPPSAGTPSYDRGPQQGIANNNNGTNMDCQADGGVGNAGGGAGGTGSGPTPPPGSPPNFECNLRVQMGEAGFGPTLDGMINTGSPPNALYAAGQGGDSGCFPAVGAGCSPGEIGGLGGAGGTSGRVGEAGVPRTTTAACTPLPNVVQPIAQPSPIAIAMIPPISVQSAGSGGGGGGDHLQPTGVPPANDDQGAGGGGGGGGLRISSLGAYAQGAAAAIVATGSFGQTAQQQGGGGGSGSGGEVWIQSFSTVTITATAVMNVDGPGRFQPTVGLVGCSFQAAGGGGDGLVQIEAGQGPPPTASFNLQPTPSANNGAVFSAPPFQYAGVIAGFASSGFLHTGVGAPDYTTPTEVFSLGDVPGATLVISYRGAQEAINSTPANPILDPATIKSTATGGGPITAANIDELDGFPWIEWTVNLTFPPPPTSTLASILPSVDSIAINFSAAVCP